MTPTNILILCSDQHARSALGCYGHEVVRTPNLDRLATAGTRFATAYSSSPICVPARGSMATGRYVHQCRVWSSAQPYDGRIEGWAHRLQEQGHRTAAIGKLHYRSSDDPNGFDQEILPMHLPEKGWTTALLRGHTPPIRSNPDFANQIGWGESDYTRYDRSICQAACRWLREVAPRLQDRPWALFISFVCPHNPFIAPVEFADLYPLERVAMPKGYDQDRPKRHPTDAAIERCFNHDDYFLSEKQVRTARASYYGLCSFLDQQVGQVLETLEDARLAGRTRVLYTSDHGEMLGHLGFWAKSLMYEDSAGIPMILAGPDVPAGEVVDTPVSHVDLYPTILQAAAVPFGEADLALPGHSLIDIARGSRPDRTVVTEYHDGGSPAGLFMIRNGRWKFVYHPDSHPQLFDLESDPDELFDLGQDPAYTGVRHQCESRLRSVLNPDVANHRAFADQAKCIERAGGKAAILAQGDFADRQNYTPVPTFAA